jgi:hypothetical protein
MQKKDVLKKIIIACKMRKLLRVEHFFLLKRKMKIKNNYLIMEF